MTDSRIEQVTRREFDRLEGQVEDQRRELIVAALDIREIKTVQASDSKKIGHIFDAMEKLAGSVSSNKVQIAKLVVYATPVNAAIAYLLSKYLVK